MEVLVLRIAAYVLLALSGFFLLVSSFNPSGTEFPSRYYLSVSIILLFTGQLLFLLMMLIEPGRARR